MLYLPRNKNIKPPYHHRQFYDYNNRPGVPEAVGHWVMNEGSGSDIYDLSSYRNHAEIYYSSSTPTWDRGKFGSCIRIPDHYLATSLRIQNADSELALIDSDCTVTAWVNVDLSAAAYHGLVGNDFTSGYWTCVRNTGTLTFWAGSAGTFAESTGTLSDLTWHHVAFVVTDTGAGISVDFYIDGVYDSTDTNATDIGDGGSTFYIGNDGRDGAGYELAGLVDDLRVYNEILSPPQIQSLMNDPFREWRTQPIVFAAAGAPAEEYISQVMFIM